MIKYIKENCVDFYKECHDWKEAIVYAGYLLEKNGYIDHQYINDMVNIIEKMALYCSHARGCLGSRKTKWSCVSK